MKRFAISTDSGNVSAHFGRCPSFTIIDIEAGKTVRRETVVNPGHEPGRIPRFLQDHGVQCIICGGMGMRAQGLFDAARIETILGVGGTVDDVISELEQGALRGGASTCKPGGGRGYGLDKTVCNHED